MWPLQRVGPHRITVPPHRRSLWLVCGGAHNEGPPVLCGGVPGQGHRCQHTVAKCANCRGPHFGQANACPKKKAARGDAKGWRSPSPTCRQRGEASRPEEPPTTTQGTLGDEMEVKKEHEPGPEGMEV